MYRLVTIHFATDRQTDRQTTLSLQRWLGGVVVRELDLLSTDCEFHSQQCTAGLVLSTWMGDRLWAGKPSPYVTSHLGQLSLSCLRGR